MARFSVYAEVVTPEHPQSTLYSAGKLAQQPGRLLREYLTESGGAYEFRMPIPEELRSRLRQVLAISADPRLTAIAEVEETVISLEHLRHLDPDTTRILCGHRLEFTQEEARRLRPFDSDRAVPDGQATI